MTTEETAWTTDTDSEAMPQAVEMYRHYTDEQSFARDREALRALGWRVEGVRSCAPHRRRLRRPRQQDSGPEIDTHYLRSTWPDSWQ